MPANTLKQARSPEPPVAPERPVTNMDVPRASARRSRYVRRVLLLALVAVALAGVTVGFSRLKSAAPVVDEDLLWVGVVERGEFLRSVRGNGTLVPKVERWIPAPGEGRVERIHIQPGETVEAGQAILTLSNPVLERDVQDARWQLAAAEAELKNKAAQLEGQLLDREDAIVTIDAELTVAKLAADRDQQLLDEGILAQHQRDTSRAKHQELETRLALAHRRLDKTRQATQAELAVHEATVEQLRSLQALRKRQLADLNVSSSEAGVLQQLLVEEGQQVTPGTSLAKVARPDDLKAELRIPETQTRDIVLGQKVAIDTRNGIVQGRVVRIDPAVSEGSVTVEVELMGTLPRGARPDLSVEGTIEIERLDNVLFMDRPASGRENGRLELFRVDRSRNEAVRTMVHLGRSSVNAIEIVSGLEEGDRVVLSDMSKWNDVDLIRLK